MMPPKSHTDCFFMGAIWRGAKKAILQKDVIDARAKRIKGLYVPQIV